MATQELSKTPLYVPFVSGYDKKKTASGIVEGSIATLKRYYSSIDAEIYLGNDYVEDICDMEWQIQQQSMPIYGFNSYTFDDIAVGARTIRGQFQIRFTSPNYLFEILSRAKEMTIIKPNKYVTPTHDRVLGEATGAINKNTLGEVAGDNHGELWPQTFDIDIVMGKPARGFDPVHVIFENVRILSAASGVSSSSPVPITEVYTFIAKDVKTLA